MQFYIYFAHSSGLAAVRVLFIMGLLMSLSACLGGGGGSSEPLTPEQQLMANVAKVVLLIRDNQQLANAEARIEVTAIARDNNNNPIANVPLHFSSQSETAILNPANGKTNAMGILTTYITNNQVESFLLSASAGNVKSEFVTVEFIAAAQASAITLLANQSTAKIGNTIQLTAIARDNQQQPLPNTDINWHSSSATVLIEPFRGKTDASGRMTVDVSTDIIQKVSITAQTANIRQTINLEFNDGIETVASLTLLANQTQQLADGKQAIMLTAIARDTNNLALTDVLVHFASDSATAIFSPSSARSNADGIVTSLVTNSITEKLEVYAMAGDTRSSKLNLNFATTLIDERVHEVSTIVRNNSQAADGNSNIIVDVVVRDGQNNLLPNIAVNLLPESNYAIFSSLHGITDDKGRFTSQITSTYAENFALTAIAGGKNANPVSISFVSPTTGLAIQADNTVLAVGRSANIRLTVYQNGNQALANTEFTASVTGNAKITSKPTSTDSIGQAQFSVTSNRGENVIVTVSSGGFTQSLNLYFGAQLILLPSNSQALGEANLTAVLFDAYQSPLSDKLLNFAFVGRNQQTLSHNQVITAVDGTANIKVIDIIRAGGIATVKASIADIEAQARVNFRAEFASGRQLSLSSEHNIFAPNASAEVIARVVDEYGIPVTGQNIRFTVQGNASLTPTQNNTNAAGEVITRVRANTGKILVTASADTVNQTIELFFGAKLNLLTETKPGVADGHTPTSITAIITDNNGSAIAGANISTVINQGQGFVSPATVISDELGRAVFALTSTTVGKVQLSAKAGNVSSDSHIVEFFTPGIIPNLAKIELIAHNSPQAADGSQINLTAIARDAQGIAIAGVPIDFIHDSNTAIFTALNGISAADGRVMSNISNHTVEQVTITARAAGINSNPITVIFNALAVANMQLSSVENILRLDELAIIDLILYDGNEPQAPLANTPFTALVSGQAKLQELPTHTDENGKARFYVANQFAENVNLHVTAGNITKNLNLYFGARLSLLPSSSTAIGEMQLTALLKDARHAPLANQELNFAFASTNNKTLVPVTARTDEQGLALVLVRDLHNEAGMTLVEVRRGSLKARAEIRFGLLLPDDSILSLSSPQQVLAVNDQAEVFARLTDSYGQPLANQLINFSSKSFNEVHHQAQVSTDQNGMATFKITAKQAGTVTVLASSAQYTMSLDLYFGAKLSLQPSQTTAPADADLGTKLIATVVDGFNQAIANIPVVFKYYFPDLQHSHSLHTDEQGQAEFTVFADKPGLALVEASAGLLPISTANIRFTPLPAHSIDLSVPSNTLDLNQQVTITALVLDKQGQAVPGVNVEFSSNLGNINPSAISDADGLARVNFAAATQAGIATITAKIGEISRLLHINVQAAAAGSIEVVSIEPRELGISGTGVAQTATITFMVRDGAGNPVDKQNVQFRLGEARLNGGEKLSFTSGMTNNGLVSTVLQSGIVSGTVDVIASVLDGKVSAIAKVLIVSSYPDAKHFSLAAKYLNIAGGVQFGLENLLTAYLGDRYGNVVASETSVSFISDGGLIGRSVGQAFTTTSNLGQATAVLQSAAPTTPNLGGSAFLGRFGYACQPPYTAINSSIEQYVCGNPGLVSIVAYTTGSESFTDLNGNGRYDSGEPFTDLSEPFIDSNGNGIYDAGEIYIDVNQDGRYTPANGRFDEQTVIWTTFRVLFSAQTLTPIISPATFSIGNGRTQQFSVSGISDIYGNALVGGTRVSIETTAGILGGTTEFTIEDNAGLGIVEFYFTLSSLPPDDEGVYPAPRDVTITLNISQNISNEAPGYNGALSVPISGKINLGQN
jgi:adhesin/invasin